MILNSSIEISSPLGEWHVCLVSRVLHLVQHSFIFPWLAHNKHFCNVFLFILFGLIWQGLLTYRAVDESRA